MEDKPSISNILYVLMGVLNYDGEVAMGTEQALAMISRGDYDAVLVDLRFSNLSTKQMMLKIKEIRPRLVNRVLPITGETEQPKIIGQLGRPCLPRAADIRLMEDVHRRLLALWEPPARI